ncbi:MAG TPA: F0F1 ATP synthase subunit A [Alphaproteobacteria bacterium]|nr:F0F1 ATP synthase subunit A [Alphaproteobacteria bacterium]
MHSPLEQFEIHRLIHLNLGGFDASFTNASLFMVIVSVLVTMLLTLPMRRATMVPGRWQSVVEMSYEFVASMLSDNAGKGSSKYFPFVFTLFMFILGCNLMGLVPFTYTVTSQIIVTFAFAIVINLGVTVLGLAKHGPGWLRLFVPSGVPLVLLVILVPIEIVSYLSRPMSLSVRLFANMMGGHTILKVFGGFAVMLGMFGFVPWLAIVAVTALEFLVAVLQAYVFAILTCIYLSDALHVKH